MKSNNQMIDVTDRVYYDIQLETCPFCGKPACFYREIHGAKYYEHISIQVSCVNCGAGTRKFYTNDLAIRYPEKYSTMFPNHYKPYTEFDAARDAADSWNRRI